MFFKNVRKGGLWYKIRIILFFLRVWFVFGVLRVLFSFGWFEFGRGGFLDVYFGVYVSVLVRVLLRVVCLFGSRAL